MTHTSGGSPAANEVASFSRWSGCEGTAVVLILTAGLASWNPLATSTKALASAGSPNTRKLNSPLRAAGAEVALAGGAASVVVTSAGEVATGVALDDPSEPACGATTGVAVG